MAKTKRRKYKYHVIAGRSILQSLEDELLAAMEKATRKKVRNRHRAEGRVSGLARAIAIMRAPYSPAPTPEVIRQARTRLKHVHEQVS